MTGVCYCCLRPFDLDKMKGVVYKNMRLRVFVCCSCEKKLVERNVIYTDREMKNG